MRRAAIAFAGIAGALLSSHALSVLLFVAPASQTLSIGDQASIDVSVSGLGNGIAPSLAAFDIDVTFDPSILSPNAVVYGDLLLGDELDVLGLGSVQIATLGAAKVNVYELSLDSASDLVDLQADAFRLFRLTFDATGPGTSPIVLSVNALADENGDSVQGYKIVGGEAVVRQKAGQVPGPGTLALAAVGVPAALVARRRRRT